jgi:hypothetical protein
MIPHSAQLDIIPKLGVPQNLSTDSIQSRIFDDHFGLLSSLFVVLQVDDAWWETSLEFLSVFWWDGGGDLDMG